MVNFSSGQRITVRGEEITNENGIITGYKGAEPTYLHTINPAKSELYGASNKPSLYHTPSATA